VGVIGLFLVLMCLRRSCLSRLPVKKVLAKEGTLAVEIPEEREAREALEAANEVRQ